MPWVYGADGYLAYSILFDYDAQGKVIRKTNPLGDSVTYAYDAAGKLTQEVTPTKKTDITYDLAARPTSVVVEGSNGDILRIEKLYDALGNVIAEIDPQGNETRFEYNRDGKPTRIIHVPVLLDGEWICPETHRTYDGLGNLLSETDPNGNTTTYTYNVRGQPVLISYPDGTEEKNVYGLEGWLQTHVDRCGLSLSYVLDYKGRPLNELVSSADGERLKETIHNYEGGLLASTLHPDGTTTCYFYNAAGQLVEKQYGREKTSYAYDPLGRKSEEMIWTAEGGTRRTYQYDFLDRVIREEVQDVGGRTLTWKTFEYDFDGNVIAKSEGGNESRMDYGLSGPTTMTDPLDHQTIITYDRGFLLQGRRVLQTTTTDPLGNQTITTYDPSQHVHAIEKRDSAQRLLARTRYIYDLAGNKLREIHTPISDAVAGEPYTIEWAYDNMGRPLSIAEGKRNRRVTHYEYDLYGRLISTTKPSGVVIDRSYDALGRLRSESGPNFYDTYSYDLADRLLDVTTGDGKVTCRTYNAEGHLMSETLANGQTLTYERDAQGKPLEVTLPDRSKIAYTYQGPFVDTLSRGSYTFRYTYNSQGKVSRVESPIQSTALVYDATGRLATSTSDSYKQFLHYDAAGNLVREETRDPLTSYTQTYRYDNLYQLISEEGLINNTYRSDSLHNRVEANGGSYLYDDFNQLAIADRVPLIYDGDGRTIAQGNIRYTYDSRDRLIAIENPGLKRNYSHTLFSARGMSPNFCPRYRAVPNLGRRPF